MENICKYTRELIAYCWTDNKGNPCLAIYDGIRASLFY